MKSIPGDSNSELTISTAPGLDNHSQHLLNTQQGSQQHIDMVGKGGDGLKIQYLAAQTMGLPLGIPGRRAPRCLPSPQTSAGQR